MGADVLQREARDAHVLSAGAGGVHGQQPVAGPDAAVRRRSRAGHQALHPRPARRRADELDYYASGLKTQSANGDEPWARQSVRGLRVPARG